MEVEEDARWLTRFEWVAGVDAAEVERRVLAKQD